MAQSRRKRIALGVHTQATYLKTEWLREGLFRTNLYLYHNTPAMQARWGGIYYLTDFERGRHMASKTEYVVRTEMPGGADASFTSHRLEHVARRVVQSLRDAYKGTGRRVILTRITTTTQKLRV
jgi:hypothetical protein